MSKPKLPASPVAPPPVRQTSYERSLADEILKNKRKKQKGRDDTFLNSNKNSNSTNNTGASNAGYNTGTFLG